MGSEQSKPQSHTHSPPKHTPPNRLSTSSQHSNTNRHSTTSTSTTSTASRPTSFTLNTPSSHPYKQTPTTTTSIRNSQEIQAYELVPGPRNSTSSRTSTGKQAIRVGYPYYEEVILGAELESGRSRSHKGRRKIRKVKDGFR